MSTRLMTIQGEWDPSTGQFPSPSRRGAAWRSSGSGVIDGVSISPGDLVLALIDRASTSSAADWQVNAAVAGGPGGETDTISTVTTTDGTATTIATRATAANTLYIVRSYVMGRRTNGAGFVAMRLETVFSTDAANTVSRLSELVTMLHTSEASYSATWSSGNAQMILTVTGAAAHAINWKAATREILVS